MVVAMDRDAPTNQQTTECHERDRGPRVERSTELALLSSLRGLFCIQQERPRLSRVLKNVPSVQRAETRTFIEVKSLGKAKWFCFV